MWKNSRWLIEIIIIIGIFGMILQSILFIGSNNYIFFISGQAIIFIGYIVFLIFSIFRISETSKNNNHTLQYFFKKKFILNDIWKVLLLFVIGKLTYILIMKLEFVHVFDIRGLHQSFHLTSFQSWSMIFLIVITIPIGVIAEELYFRCYLFDVQYTRFESYTWVVNGFHPDEFFGVSANMFIIFIYLPETEKCLDYDNCTSNQ
jgi:membrane protease YdiL (CAAX protease family)